MTIPEVFLVTALLNAVVTTSLFIVMPEYLIRFVGWLLTHTVYRVRTVRAGRIPDAGAILMVSNRMGWLDLLLLVVACPRSLRFAVDERLIGNRVLAWLCRSMHVILVTENASDELPSNTASGRITAALSAGEVVCMSIHTVTRLSEQAEAAHHLLSRISDQMPVMIIPVFSRNQRGRPEEFGRSEGTCASSGKRGFRSRFDLLIGPPHQAKHVELEALQNAIAALNREQC